MALFYIHTALTGTVAYSISWLEVQKTEFVWYQQERITVLEEREDL